MENTFDILTCIVLHVVYVYHMQCSVHHFVCASLKLALKWLNNAFDFVEIKVFCRKRLKCCVQSKLNYFWCCCCRHGVRLLLLIHEL